MHFGHSIVWPVFVTCFNPLLRLVIGPANPFSVSSNCMVLNEVVTQLEHCILQACVGRGGPGGLEAMLNEELVSLSDFDRGTYDDSQNDLPLKDAPTPDEFVASLISVSSSVSSVSPAAHAGHALKSLHEIERALNSLQEIERAWVGSLVD